MQENKYQTTTLPKGFRYAVVEAASKRGIELKLHQVSDARSGRMKDVQLRLKVLRIIKKLENEIQKQKQLASQLA